MTRIEEQELKPGQVWYSGLTKQRYLVRRYKGGVVFIPSNGDLKYLYPREMNKKELGLVLDV